MSGPMEFVVPTAKLDALTVDLKRLVLGVPVKAARGLKAEAEPLSGDASLARVRLISPTAPRIGGFELVGRIEHRANRGNVVRRMAAADLDPRFYAAEAECEHCGTIRNRRDTFLLRGADGVIRQVGRSCLQDYAEGSSEGEVTLAVARAELVGAMAARIEEASAGKTEGVHIGTFLAVATECAMEHGWVGASKAKEMGVPSTVERAIEAWQGGLLSEIRPAAGARASKALEWIRSLAPQDDEYLEQVRKACAGDVILPTKLALVTSVLWAYDERRRFARDAKGARKEAIPATKTSREAVPGPQIASQGAVLGPERAELITSAEWLRLAVAAKAAISELVELLDVPGTDRAELAAKVEAALGPMEALWAALAPEKTA